MFGTFWHGLFFYGLISPVLISYFFGSDEVTTMRRSVCLSFSYPPPAPLPEAPAVIFLVALRTVRRLWSQRPECSRMARIEMLMKPGRPSHVIFVPPSVWFGLSSEFGPDSFPFVYAILMNKYVNKPISLDNSLFVFEEMNSYASTILILSAICVRSGWRDYRYYYYHYYYRNFVC